MGKYQAKISGQGQVVGLQVTEQVRALALDDCVERYDGWTGAPNRGRSSRSFTSRFAEQSGVRVPRLAAVGIALMD